MKIAFAILILWFIVAPGIFYFCDLDRRHAFAYKCCRKEQDYNYKCKNHLCLIADHCPYYVRNLKEGDEDEN